MEQWNAGFSALIAEALRPAEDAPALAPVLIGLLDFDVHARLVAAGLTTAEAASLIAGMITAWIKDRRAATRRTANTRRKQ